MNITETNFNWSGNLQVRKKTSYIILHHSAGNGSAEDIHRIHLGNGWTGIGYHFYIRTDGGIFRGRPVDTVGAHTLGKNTVSIGICFEGNFETSIQMNEKQLKSGIKLIAYLKNLYPEADVRKHSDFVQTSCPGVNFPFDTLSEGKKRITELETVNDIVWELTARGIITDTDLWLKKLAEDENSYWLARKTANMTVNR